MDNDERRYLELQFHAIHDRFDNLEDRLNGMDKRITVNAEERLADVEDLRDDLDEHKERNHGGGKIATGGLAGAIAAIMVAVFEALKRLQ